MLGLTTVPITATTTGASSGNYSFSYAGSFVESRNSTTFLVVTVALVLGSFAIFLFKDKRGTSQIPSDNI